MMVGSLQHITVEAREFPTDEGTTNIEKYVDHYENMILERK